MNSEKDDTRPMTKLEELGGEELEQVSGGLLLPAVQKVREAASRTQAAETAHVYLKSSGNG